MKTFLFVLFVSTACAYPLIENREPSQELLPIESGVNGQTDDQMVPNVEENKNLANVNENGDLAALIQPALELSQGIKTIFNVENWNGGTVNTGLTIQNAYFISNASCSGTQCTAVKL